jgi:hypothetical protein
MMTESPFSSNIRVRIADHDVQVTVRGETEGMFNLHWASLAENAQVFFDSVHLFVAASNAYGLTVPPAPVGAPAPEWTPPAPAAPPAAAASDSPWDVPAPAAPAPMCDHGQAMKLVPAGVSKKTGKPYPGFYACANPDRNSQCKKTYPAS